jgi:hypothetical protein
MRFLLLLLSIGPYITSITYAQPTVSTDVTVNFSWQNHYAPIEFNKPVYSNVHGQLYSLTTLRYYVSNVALHRADGSVYQQKMPVLIDHDNDAMTSVRLNSVPLGTYTSVSFILGVDSVDNVSGPREGALDPLNGMYWTWATGYIFFKLEGTSAASSQPKNIIEFHLGGFEAPYNNIRRVELPLRRPLQADGRNTSLGIVLDVGAFVDADGGIDFSAVSSVTDVRSAGPYMKRLQGAFHVR